MTEKIFKSTNQLKEWNGTFGVKYTDRNTVSIKELTRIYKDNYGITRTELNSLFLGSMDRSIRILEVGTNLGNQLLFLQGMGFKNLYGIEPQQYAIDIFKKRTKNIDIRKADIFDIPFENGYFDLVFTAGVLIHIHPNDIEKAMKEIYRCSKRYIWGFECYSKDYKEILYRGKKELLWKADYLKIYKKLFPDIKEIKVKFVKYLNDKDKMDVMFLLEKT